MASSSSMRTGVSQPPLSSTNSDDGNQPGGTLAPKNRACPFCNQFFTSSSLGRHLDLYIKPKNPKAPDGVHDVDQIRKIRSQITRRHARTSTGKRHDSERANSIGSASDAPDSASKSTPPSHAPPTLHHHHLPPPPPQAASLMPPQFTQSGFPHPPPPAPHGSVQDIHRLKWQATGVINDIPPRTADSPRIDIFREPEQRQKYLEERDNGRAAELALREVLHEVQAAQIRLRNTPLFPDFDFFSCNFPSLCFKLLAPPPTLFSTTPLTVPDAWPVAGPPDQQHLYAMKTILSEKIAGYHTLQQEPSPAAGSPTSSSSSRPPLSPVETRRYTDHLDRAWMQWSALPSSSAVERWHTELLRAAADERSMRLASAAALDQARADIERLNAQLADQAAAFAADTTRPAAERTLWRTHAHKSAAAPLAPHVPGTLAAELAALARWDFHALVAKWRDSLRAGAAPSAWAPPPPPSSAALTPASAGANAEAQTPRSSASNGLHDAAAGRENGPAAMGVGSSGMPGKRGLGDTGVLDYQMQGARPAPAMREFVYNNGSANGTGRASPGSGARS